MTTKVEAVIQALKVALEESLKATGEQYWSPDCANRWINRLPGARLGRWKDLKLREDGIVERKAFIGHVRATIAYLETNKDEIMTSSIWPWRRPAKKPAETREPIDAEFKDVKPSKDGRSLRVLK